MLRHFILSLCFLALPVFAVPTAHLIFGDSLSDEGRIYALSDHTVPGPPHFEGRYSNGPLWSEFIQGPRLNFAYAGAKTDTGNILTDQLGSVVDNTGLQSQLEEYFDSNPDLSALPSMRVVINIGANDFLRLIETDEVSLELLHVVVREAVDNIILAAQTLEDAGAEDITLIGLPNLGNVPMVKGMTEPQKSLMQFVSMKFNYMLKHGADRNHYKMFDTYGFANQLMGSPSKYGLTNVKDACYDKVTATVCAEPNTYFFWDEVHPSSHVHELLAGKL